MQFYDNDKPYNYEDMEKHEIKLYDNIYFKPSAESTLIDMNSICSRKENLLVDRDYNLPQNIFLIRDYNGKTIIGRKIRSILRIENKINAINCSMITAPMLLGILNTRTKNKRKIEISYFPFNNAEKATVFNEIKNNRMADIDYPYNYFEYETNKEQVSPPTGWSFNPNRKRYLGYGENHLRQFTNNYFESYDSDNKNIYDPACSTGEFLFEFKKKHPKSHTIGHDLSQEMIDYAKDYVDEYYCCNAINSPLKDNSIDLMFLRFLNSQVVSSTDATEMFLKLLTKVKKGGLIIAFGHTAVLLSKEWLTQNGVKLLNCSGYDKKRDAIFQYYVMEVL